MAMSVVFYSTEGGSGREERKYGGGRHITKSYRLLATKSVLSVHVAYMFT